MNNNTQSKLTNLLGLAQRANKIVSGESSIQKLVQSGKAKLVLLAEDASEGTCKKYTDMTKFYQVRLIASCPKDAMGACIGKSSRAAVAVQDAGFAKALLKLLDAKEEI